MRGGIPVRSFWKGAITFGLVTIPVRLYVATESKDPKFHYLHAKDNAPVRYEKICSQCGEILGREDIVLGYEFKKGHYVPVEEEELQALPRGEARAVEIVAFIPEASMDPLFFAKAYYLEPAEGGSKAYALLRAAMERSRRAALSRITLRTRPSLALVRLHESGALLLETLYDPDEVRDAQALSIPEQPAVGERELGLALTLVDALAGAFEPSQVPDTYRQALEELLSKKVETAAVGAEEGHPEGKVVDLMAALEASITRVRKEEDRVPADAGRDVARSVR